MTKREATTGPTADVLADVWAFDSAYFAASPTTMEYHRESIPGEFGPLVPPKGEPTYVRRSDSGVIHGRYCGDCFAMDADGETLVGTLRFGGPS